MLCVLLAWFEGGVGAFFGKPKDRRRIPMKTPGQLDILLLSIQPRVVRACMSGSQPRKLYMWTPPPAADSTADLMANKSRREKVRGVERETLDLLSESTTSRQWEEVLKGPLELAAARGNRSLAQKLVAAGATIGHALHEAVGGGHGDIVRDLVTKELM